MKPSSPNPLGTAPLPSQSKATSPLVAANKPAFSISEPLPRSASLWGAPAKRSGDGAFARTETIQAFLALRPHTNHLPLPIPNGLQPPITSWSGKTPPVGGWVSSPGVTRQNLPKPQQIRGGSTLVNPKNMEGVGRPASPLAAAPRPHPSHPLSSIPLPLLSE